MDAGAEASAAGATVAVASGAGASEAGVIAGVASAGDDCPLEELQPGARITSSTRAWMPATIPRFVRIFMGECGWI
jgi:hypothetical protein